MQVHADERGETCAKFLADAVAWFASQGITIERVMTDNARNYTISRAFHKVLRRHRIKHKRIRAYRPQTNGKVERFNRTLVDEFAYARTFANNQARLDAYPAGCATTTPDADTPDSTATRPTKPSTTSVGRTARTERRGRHCSRARQRSSRDLWPGHRRHWGDS